MSSHAAMTMLDSHASRQGGSFLSRLGLVNAISIVVGAIIVGLLIYGSMAHGGHAAEHHEVHAPHYWGIGILPFIAILASIAFLPLIPATHHWWENNLNRLAVAMGCAGATILFYVATAGAGAVPLVLEHAIVAEYIPFIMLLFSLYVISGGICLKGDLAAKPLTNTAFLAIGAGIASFIGTTGASMLLIRPLLKTNSERKHVTHTVVFFIFLVSNIGGTLLPIGDPPLFLGFLYGVPFFWTLNLWMEWAVACAILLVVYYIWDTLAYRKEEISNIQRDVLQRQPLRMQGFVNIALLAGVVLAVAFVNDKKPLPLIGWTPFPFLRELIMLVLVGLSLAMTPRGVREFNKFNYAAIAEVAALFIGIFIAMQVPLEVLKAYGGAISERMNQPWQYFWATGGLSAFLDNAPTYVVFFTLGREMPVAEGVDVVTLASGETVPTLLLIAVSLGAVFMGAMTYIGNGPNFMVKAIAEQSGVRMPSFPGYMFKYSIPVLVPIFVLITLLFLI